MTTKITTEVGYNTSGEINLIETTVAEPNGKITKAIYNKQDEFIKKLIDFVQPDIKNLIKRSEDYDDTQATQVKVYEDSYTIFGLREMYAGTGNPYYVVAFFELLTNYAENCHEYETTSQYVGGLPLARYGASGTYLALGDTWPNHKAVEQWAMTAYVFLYDLIVADNGFKDEAIEWWKFLRRNITELYRVKYGPFHYMIDGVAESARDKIAHNDTSGRWGYWSSNIGVAMAETLLEQKIQLYLGEDPLPYVAFQAKDSVATDWWNWWKANVIFNGAAATWDVGNPNLQVANGWGYPGQEKAPDIGHGFGRYMFLAWALGETQIYNGLNAQFDQYCVLGPDYVTPDGTHIGKIAGVTQISNYINGVDTPFRNYENVCHSAAGMASMCYYSKIKNKNVLLDLLTQCSQYVGASNPKCTGTYSRHVLKNNFNTPNSSNRYSGFCMLGTYLSE